MASEARVWVYWSNVLTPPCAVRSDLLGPPGSLPPMSAGMPAQGAYEAAAHQYGGTPSTGAVHQRLNGVQPGGGLAPYDLVSHAMVRGCNMAATCPLSTTHTHVQAQYASQQTSFDGMRPAISGSFTAMMGDADLTERCMGVSTPTGAAGGADPEGKKRRNANAAQERRGARSTSKYRGVTHHCRTGRWEAHLWKNGKQVRTS